MNYPSVNLTPPALIKKNWQATFICLAITALTLLIYAQVCGHAFLKYDDDIYITGNSHIKDGLTLSGVLWAFSTFYESNWIPLTWLSHMVDVQLFGMASSGHHLTNMFLHLVNSLLLFFLFRKMTAAVWRPALLALLFAVHPLHVESVAWAAERKDLLCGLFFLLTLFFYASYAQQRHPGKFLLALLFFIFGLLSKPMVVTLPCVLILLDIWPLERFKRHDCATRYAIAEKIPFFLASAAISVITIIAQTNGGSVVSMAQHSASDRLCNAALSYMTYLGKIFLPVKLSVFYPYPESLPLWQTFTAIFLLVVISALAFFKRETQPYLAVGWAWFLVTLIPVIGIVQVGEQAMADRYAYLPIIGIFVAVVWGGEDLRKRYQLSLPISKAAGLLVIGALALLAGKQTSLWQNQYSLFQHAVAVAENNYVALFHLGNALVSMDKFDEAKECFAKSINIRPTAKAYTNLAYTFEKTGRADIAADNYLRALELDPNNINAHYNLGLVMVRQWRLEEAVSQFKMTLQLDQSHIKARQNLEKAQRLLASGQGRNRNQ